MQIKQLDARGKTCPLPVIETKKVLETITDGKVEVLVDNAIAVQNLCKSKEPAAGRKEEASCLLLEKIQQIIGLCIPHRFSKLRLLQSKGDSYYFCFYSEH